MKILLLPAVLILALTLSGCSLLSSAGSLVNGMFDAIGRTFSQADTPGGEVIDTDAVAQRGAEISAKGTHGGTDAPADTSSTGKVARR